MKFEKIKKRENGFILLESLFTLSILSVISLSLYPLLNDWMLIKEKEKLEVEDNRYFYEQSFKWKEEMIINDQENDHSKTNDTLNKQTGIDIYEIQYKR